MIRSFVYILLFFLPFAANAAVFTVVNNNDSGAGSLRDAITQAAANGSVVQDQIVFNIPGSAPSDRIINLLSELPAVPSNVVIDGTTQPGTGLGITTAKISLVRAASDYFHGFKIDGVSDVSIYGIAFRNFLSVTITGVPFRKAGIFLNNCQRVRIGDIGKENIFTANSNAIYSDILGQTVEDIVIACNYIGIGEDGLTASPNDNGIDLALPKNIVIGGVTTQYANIVSSNRLQAIGCGGSDGTVLIQNNFVGTNRAGNRLYLTDDAIGIFASGENAVFTIRDNIVGGQNTGIKMNNANTPFVIAGNRIGTGPNGNENYPNVLYGIWVLNCNSGGLVGGPGLNDVNYITNNDYGVYIEQGTLYPVRISRNSIYCNRKEGIAFKETSPKPPQIRISTITPAGASGTYQPNSIVELFYDDNCPNCEGKVFLGQAIANGAGNWSYTGAIAGNIVATGTSNGATSEFSKPTLNSATVSIGIDYCGSSSGFIRGLVVTDASFYEWRNAANVVVGNTLNLENVPAGTYQLFTGQPGGCLLQSVPFVVTASTITFEVLQSTITPANCSNANGGVAVNSFKGETPIQFRWYDSSGNLVSSTRDLQNVLSGTYTLVASNAAGCQNTAGTFVVPDVPRPVINLSGLIKGISCDNKYVSGSGIVIDGTTGPYTYEWYDENNQRVSQELNLRNVGPARYELVILDKFGCEVRSGYIDFTTFTNMVLNVPATFTPNADGINDTWKIRGSENYPEGRFEIYNRHGRLVFSSIGYTTEFDGNMSGKPLPVGVYYYVIWLNGECPRLSGSITIIR